MKKEPVFDQINIISKDLNRSLAFYDLIGVKRSEVFSNSAGKPMHVNGAQQGGLDLDLDDVDFARVWNEGWRNEGDIAGRVVVGFRLSSRDAVDEQSEELAAAGYTILQPPYDAFWGSRYAIVEDPDGVAVGLMSPPDPGMRSRPPDA